MLTLEQSGAVGGPPARPTPPRSARRTRRRRLLDRTARRLVSLGGMVVIGSILAIVFVIVAEFYPLFRPPSAAYLATVSAGGDPPIAAGLEEYREVAYLVTAKGVRFVSLKTGGDLKVEPPAALSGAEVTTCSPLRKGSLALGLSDGRVLALELGFEAAYVDGQRKIEPSMSAGEPAVVDPEKSPVKLVDLVQTEGASVLAASTGTRDIAFSWRKRSLTGRTAGEGTLSRLTLPGGGEVTALLLDGRGERLIAGTSSGRLVLVDLSTEGSPKVFAEAAACVEGSGISSLGFLIGDQTVVVGDSGGEVSTWQLLAAGGGAPPRLDRMHRFPGHAGPVAAFSASQRNKSFLTADGSGRLRLDHGTTGRTRLELQAEGGNLRAVALSPKGDGLLAVDSAGRISTWELHDPHPEASLGALFGKTWYEGYAEPRHVWQSSGATDDFEPKLGLTPLIFGTLKGTFYALLFAVPIAVLAALYASQFLHPSLKAFLKPLVEIMAALPSVVLGFIAGLWLAPMVEKVVPGLFILPWTEGLAVVIASLAYQKLPRKVRGGIRPGMEVFLLVPVVLAAGWLAFALGDLLTWGALHGDFRTWLLGVLGLTFDQRNSLVVGIAMGFAVIPIIFTIAEDSLSGVPRHLVAGSLALGATRWQTALRVVLPTASPGIFSAVMIGLGRAVGETMIVLMATGNTPIMDWIPFNGFRALSANVAVELPEAPEGGTLYRVLFFSAFLLFVMTFLVNTVAEVVRLHLRKRYRSS